MPEPLLRAADVAALLAISVKSVYRLASEGRLPGVVKLSDRIVRFSGPELEKWIEEAKEVRA